MDREFNVSVAANVTVAFSEAMDATTINGDTIQLRDPSGARVIATVSYNNAGFFIATLVPAAPLTPRTTYTALVKGGATDPRVKDRAGNALAADLTWTFTTVDAPPQVVPVTPAPNATDVPTGVAPTATFSKAINPMTLNTLTVLLQDDTANLPVPVTVPHGPNAFTVAIVPQGPLQPQHNYTVTLKGVPNEPHIIDSTGIPLPADSSWSFTTAAPPAQITGTSIFADSVTPAHPINEAGDSNAVEVGLKFRSDTDGIITGVRFYKGGIENGGPHVGHLWIPDEMSPNTGTLLGDVTFTNESARGWQQASFQRPIPIKINTTYVVSYFAPHGNYAADLNDLGFALSGVDTPPLHALQEGVDGSNGVFHRDEIGFPTDTFSSANYYVDVVFVDPTLSAPQVLSTMPLPGTTNVSVGFAPTATFSELIDPTSLTDSTVMLTDAANNAVPFTWELDESGFTLTLTPMQPLQPEQAYTVTLKGGGDPDDPHITDLDGTPLAADYTWSFITEPPPPPVSTQVTMLGNWATAGGNFIAMRPGRLVGYLLGLNYAPSVLSRLLKSAV